MVEYGQDTLLYYEIKIGNRTQIVELMEFQGWIPPEQRELNCCNIIPIWMRNFFAIGLG